MKILVAIVSDNNAKQLGETILFWAPRAGFSIRVFIPSQEQAISYHNTIDHVNYEAYLDMKHIMVLVGEEPIEYAKNENFDLLVMLPDNLKRWNKTRNIDKMLIEYATDLAKARSLFSTNQLLTDYAFDNGVKMVRL